MNRNLTDICLLSVLRKQIIASLENPERDLEDALINTLSILGVMIQGRKVSEKHHTCIMALLDVLKSLEEKKIPIYCLVKDTINKSVILIEDIMEMVK
jgi:hypothetical protein